MPQRSKSAFVAFLDARRIASGELVDVARAVKTALGKGEDGEVLVFDGEARLVEVDFRGSAAEVDLSATRALEEIEGEENRRGPGRPKLGVVAREVTLLPRHWSWLAEQPGGASVALRKLVEEASRDRHGRDKRRRAQEATYRFLSAMAGDRPQFEEAARALFAGDEQRFGALVAIWPADIAEHARRLSGEAFART
ncbi:MAG TPA: DUF2239 family protein [Roseiarcus sp.]|nr:DUF2239 family protein [Roseiarcus sp.]